MVSDRLQVIAEKASASRVPVWGQFELTPFCNFNCNMCYIHRPELKEQYAKGVLPASFWIDIARQAADAGMLVLLLTGGETLLYPGLDELMEEVVRLGIMVSFNTNGALIDSEQVSRIQRYKCSKINISLYGASDETYGRLTGCSDGFTKVSSAIDMLRRAGLNVYINSVLTQDNMDDIPAMVHFAASRGLTLHGTSYMFPPRDIKHGDVTGFSRLSPRKAAAVSWKYRNLMYGSPQCKAAAAFCALRNHRLADVRKKYPRVGRCQAGRCEFAVTWRGEMQPCIMFPAVRKNLREMSFAAAWKKCVDDMDSLAYPDKCSFCRHQDTCPVCRAAIYLETGTHDQAPEYLCEYSEEMLRIWEDESRETEIDLVDKDDLPPEFDFRGCMD